MAHNIATINGQVSMVYQGRTPWHELGNFRARLSSIDEALDAANLRWQVGSVPLFLADGTIVQGHKMSGRLDANGQLAAQFGVVGADYVHSQNEANARVLEGLIDLGCTIETAGALGQGERCWMLAKLPDLTIQPVPGDDIRGYFALVWGHDGQFGIQPFPTEVRVVCQNTLRAALSAGQNWAKIQHRTNVQQKLDDAAKLIKQITTVMLANQDTYAKMARRKLTPAELGMFVDAAIPSEAGKDANGNEKVSAVILRRRATIAHLAAAGRGADMANQLISTRDGSVSLWATVNAVSEYFDHVRPAEAKSADTTRKANESALFGGNMLAKLTALSMARQLVAA